MPQLMLLMMLLAATMPAVALGKDTGTTSHAAVWTYETRERSDRGTFSSADRNLIRAWLLEAQRHENHPAAGGRTTAGAAEKGGARQAAAAGLAEKTGPRRTT